MISCSRTPDPEAIRKDVFNAEKEFEKMVSEKGIAEAFYFFADENAVIRRGEDSLIHGKENIKIFYSGRVNPGMQLTWTPEFIEVSECGTLAYTYGHYLMKTDSTESKGIFHTVWKRQKDNSWKYVWD